MNNEFSASIEKVVNHFKCLQKELDLLKRENIELKDEIVELKATNTNLKDQNIALNKTNQILKIKLDEDEVYSELKEKIYSELKELLHISPLKEGMAHQANKKRKINFRRNSDLHHEEKLLEDDETIFSSPPVGLASSPTKLKFSPIKKESMIEMEYEALNYYSSPTKLNGISEQKSDKNIYNSQLPTQYSYDSSSPTKSPSKNTKSLEATVKHDNDFLTDNRLEIIEDSEDDIDNALIKPKTPFSNITNIAIIQKPFTKLQRREYVRNELTKNFNENPKFIIDLDYNPINESNWALTDFKPNENYVKPKISKKKGYSNQQQREIDAFYEAANANLISHSSSQINSSQIYDKFPSPPGFMVSEFPSTQEELHRRNMIKKRQDDRLHRRVLLCLKVGGKTQTGEFVFFHEILNQFVLSGRYTISKST